jgi:glucokinase
VIGSVIGVDVGGTKIAVAALRGAELGESLIEPTRLDGGSAELIDQLASMVERARSDDLVAVGVGAPSVVEFETGTIVSSANIPLANVPLRSVLGERLGVPVFVDNDATVAGLAEAHDEQLRLVARHLVMLTIGTGVGGGLVLGGRIYRGATGGAGEIGHTMVGLDLSEFRSISAPAGFPAHGSLEYEAAGHALDRLVASAAADHPDSVFGRLLAEGKPATGVEAVDAAQAGDPFAMRMVELWAERVGIGVANMINTFDPEEVVIGGGVARAGDMLLEPARRVALSYVLPGLAQRTTIRMARHGVRAGVLGAALLAEQELEELQRGPATRASARSTVIATEVTQ